jgi:N6-L-threonylcarbamoyladenine synthase
MMDRKIILGIDTSNYTTSAALLYEDGELIANLKCPLTVKAGERGLRQSDAVFQHVKNIPELMDKVRSVLLGRTLSAVGVSSRPRNVEGSYMPCFLTGLAVAESVSATLDIPIFQFSHQCGHIMAAIFSSGIKLDEGECFGAFHISGGTTELLLVRASEFGFKAEVVGGTLDLNAGQLVDRVAVKLGLGFPGGPALEKLAMGYDGRIKGKKLTLKDCYVNLSGLENAADELYRKSSDASECAAFIFKSIARGVGDMTRAFLSKYGDMPMIFAGGVMCNSIIRNELEGEFKCYFAKPEMSADNAVGIAELTRITFLK